MTLTYIIAFFLLGLYLGSFYTVVGLRLPRHENFISNRSYCDSCHHELTLLDMVPVLSYLFLRGKCRYCKTKIDSLSTSMEIFTGILFALSYYAFGLSGKLLIALGIVTLLIIISVSDISYMIIPDELLIFASGYFILVKFFTEGLLPSLFSILSGLALFFILYTIMIIGSKILKKECLGGGDIKLMFVFGLVVNPVLGLVVLFIGSLLALPISLYLLYRKNERLVPFGPFLLISFAFVFFTKIDMNMILTFLRGY